MLTNRMIRLMSIGVITVGATLLSGEASAQCRGMGCSTVYCESADCDNEEWLEGYCAGRDCPSSLPGCSSDFGTCGDQGLETIVCNEVKET